MLRFGEGKLTKEKFYTAKKPMKVLVVHIDNIVISKLVKTKTNPKYLVVYLDKYIRPLVLIMPKMRQHVKL